jgi:hypothetical protein
MMRKTVVAVLGAVLLAGAAGTAQAAPSTANQVAELLRLNPGSHQVAENAVQVAPGAVLTVPDRSASGDAAPAAACPSGDVCLNDGYNYTSTQLNLYYCGFYNLGTIHLGSGNWNDHTSSYRNNQTGHATAVFSNWNGSAFVTVRTSTAVENQPNLSGLHIDNLIDGVQVC